MHKGHKTLIELLLIELYTLDLRRKFILYTWQSRACVSATPSVFKVMVRNLHHSKDID